MLKDALHIFKREDIRNAIIIMKKRLDNIGFCHNNLRPYNIIICKSGVARPLRYWYAIWETFSNNNISQLLETIDAHTDIKEEFYLRPLVLNDDMAEYNTSIIYEGIKRKYLGGRYGFIDEDGNRITKYTYSQASEFREGRALVATNNKWGVINDHGRKIVAEIYHSMEFDISTASFIATRDNYRYIIDYNGNIIHRTDME